MDGGLGDADGGTWVFHCGRGGGLVRWVNWMRDGGLAIEGLSGEL